MLFGLIERPTRLPLESPFKLIYGKSCHLPVELENKPYWAIRNLNLDPNLAGEKENFN